MNGDVYSSPAFLRQQQERVDAERGGPLASLLSMDVIGHPTGRIWPHNANLGPLDGQPERNWFAVARYSNGTTVEWGPTYRRG